MRRLLALDQSSKVTGWAVYNEEGGLEDYGKLEYNDADSLARILSLRQGVRQLVDDYSIEQIVIEDIQLQANNNNVTTYKLLAFTMAAILILCREELSVDCETMSSSTWKSQCGVKGKARTDQKRDAQRFVGEEFGIKAIQDIVDAICLGYAYNKKIGSNLNWA